MGNRAHKSVFPERFQLLLESTPFTKADISKTILVAEATVHKWSLGITLPDGPNIIKLSHILLQVDPKYLFGMTGRPFGLNGPSLDEVAQKIPQGERALSPCVRLIAKVSRKTACSVYRYNKEEHAFILASYFRYGSSSGKALKTKFRYRLATEKTMGDGVTGNVIRRYGGRLIVPTKEQQTYLPDRTTMDQSAFLVITTVKGSDGALIGALKIEDFRNGTINDITDTQLDDIVAIARMYLESNEPEEWWRIKPSSADGSEELPSITSSISQVLPMGHRTFI